MSISFSHFQILCVEALDRTDLGSMTVRKTRDPQSRRKSPAERKRTTTTIDPKTGERVTKPVIPRTRSDAGQSREAGTSTAQIGAVDRTVSSQEKSASWAAAAKEERRKAAKARAAAKTKKPGGSSESKPAAKPTGKELEQAGKKLLKKDVASKKPQTSSPPKRSYTKHDYSDAEKNAGGQLTSKEKTKQRSAKQNKDKRANYNAAKAKAIAAFTEIHGRPPKGKERSRLLATVQKSNPPR